MIPTWAETRGTGYWATLDQLLLKVFVSGGWKHIPLQIDSFLLMMPKRVSSQEEIIQSEKDNGPNCPVIISQLMDTNKQEFSSVQTRPYRRVHAWHSFSNFLPEQEKNKGHFSRRSYVYSSILCSTSRKNMLILMTSVSAIRIHISLYIHMPLCKLR